MNQKKLSAEKQKQRVIYRKREKKREEKGGKVKRKKRKSVIGLRDTGNYSVRREKLRTESEREIG